MQKISHKWLNIGSIFDRIVVYLEERDGRRAASGKKDQMKQYLEGIKKGIKEAELVVVGLGEEWNISPKMHECEQYQRIMQDLETRPQFCWLMPYFYYKLTDDTLKQAYKNLFALLEDKNYYVVATTVNRSFVPFAKGERFVMPCGTEMCMCDEVLSPSAEQTAFLESLDAYFEGKLTFEEISFAKDAEGHVISFNNIYVAGYREAGYLPQWNKYMSWLQGTMNRKVCLLELGAGLQFPSVIRFPFEKMTYFNQKASCFRVHKSLYQLTEEMAERSESVPVNAVELFAAE